MNDLCLRPPVAALLALALLDVPAVCRAQGTLDDLRNDVRTSSFTDDPSPRDRRDRDHPWWTDDCEDDDAESVWGELVAMVVTSPFWAPHVLMGDDLGNHSEFLSYPYKRDWRGNMLIEDSSLFAKWWHIRARGEYADDFDRLARVGGHILFDTAWRLGFDTSFDYRHEQFALAQEDHLWTGDLNLLFRFAQTEFIQMRAGAGANWLSDDAGTDWGFNFTYGGDLMPLEPFILSTEFDWGRLGHAELFHGRTTIGIEYRHVEFYTGYDYFDVGKTQIDGWIAGVRLWF